MKFIHLLPISRFVGFKFWNDRYFYLFIQRYSHVGSNISAVECIPSTYARLLEECTKTKSLSEGKRLQAHMIMSGFNPSIYTTNRLCDLYVKCGKLKDARLVFDEMPERDVFSWAKMIAGYARNGFFEDSLRLFDEMPERTVVAWNAIIAGYAQYGHAREALEIFSELQHAGMKPDRITVSSVLSVCSSLESLQDGKQVHAHSIKAGFDSDVFVGCALIDIYAKCESIEDARQVFDKMRERNVVSWNAMITGYARCGRMEEARQVFEKMPERDMVSWTAVISGYAQRECGKEALELFTEMRKVDIGLDQVTLASVLSSCAILAVVEQGKQVHAYVVKTGFHSFLSVSNALITMYANCGNEVYASQMFEKMPMRDAFSWTAMVAGYARCGSIENARRLFDIMPKRNIVSWNAIIAAYAQHEPIEQSLVLFCQLQQTDIKPDRVTFTSVVTACATLAVLDHGMHLHGHIIRAGFESGISVGNALVSMYAKCGNIDDARLLFNNIGRNTVSWNAMIAGYAQHCHCEDALELFCQMQHAAVKPDQFALASVLSACASLAALEHGKRVHSHIIRNGFESYLSVDNALITMYSKCGSIDDSEKMFHIITERDVVSWTSMIAGYTEHGYGEDALQCFEQMKQTGMNLDKFTSASVVGACSSLDAFEQGKAVHAHILKIGFELDSLVGSALVTMYSRCGNIESAHQVFEIMPEKDLVLWSAMMAGYAQNGHGEEAMKLFNEMQMADVYLDSITFASILAVCGNLADLEQGKQIHANIMKYGVDSNVSVGSALLTMYAKCGTIDIAHKVFDGMHEKDVISWTAMIVGCAQHGRGEEALQLFEQMQQTGMKPDHVSFIGVLSACSHVGLVNEAYHYFNSMNRDYGITPRIEHYACIVDLLGRAGCLDEAESFINDMPFEPGALVWGTLLGACRVHGNMKLGEKVAERLLELEPQIPTAYVLLSNIYAEAGRWDDVEKVRTMMKENCVKKEPGHSWIEITHTRGQSKVGMFN